MQQIGYFGAGVATSMRNGRAAMGRATFAILAVLCFSPAGREQPCNPPPRPLHKVNDHWTPYDPPTEFPPDAQVYTIVKGDTLWDLAQKFLGNPFLWPQIWEQNKYIRDAHWIYPGDPLVIGVKAEEVSPPAAPEQPQAPAPGAEGTPGAGAAGAPGPGGGEGEVVPVGGGNDLHCFASL